MDSWDSQPLGVTVIEGEPPTLVTDGGVRLEVSEQLWRELSGSGLDAVRPGQRLLARTRGGAVVSLEFDTVAVQVHQSRPID